MGLTVTARMPSASVYRPVLLPSVRFARTQRRSAFERVRHHRARHLLRPRHFSQSHFRRFAAKAPNFHWVGRSAFVARPSKPLPILGVPNRGTDSIETHQRFSEKIRREIWKSELEKIEKLYGYRKGFLTGSPSPVPAKRIPGDFFIQASTSPAENVSNFVIKTVEKKIPRSPGGRGREELLGIRDDLKGELKPSEWSLNPEAQERVLARLYPIYAELGELGGYAALIRSHPAIPTPFHLSFLVRTLRGMVQQNLEFVPGPDEEVTALYDMSEFLRAKALILAPLSESEKAYVNAQLFQEIPIAIRHGARLAAESEISRIGKVGAGMMESLVDLYAHFLKWQSISSSDRREARIRLRAAQLQEDRLGKAERLTLERSGALSRAIWMIEEKDFGDRLRFALADLFGHYQNLLAKWSEFASARETMSDAVHALVRASGFENGKLFMGALTKTILDEHLNVDSSVRVLVFTHHVVRYYRDELPDYAALTDAVLGFRSGVARNLGREANFYFRKMNDLFLDQPLRQLEEWVFAPFNGSPPDPDLWPSVYRLLAAFERWESARTGRDLLLPEERASLHLIQARIRERQGLTSHRFN